MSHKILYHDLVAIHKTKVTLTLNKPAYIRMCLFDLSKVLIYKFHYDYDTVPTQDYYSLKLIV